MYHNDLSPDHSLNSASNSPAQSKTCSVAGDYVSLSTLDVIIDCFNGLFVQSCTTRLVGGAEEPLYSPGDGEHLLSCVVFTRDYTSSALHEVAHWCIAGAQRRQLEDYGYWYAPDGRSDAQQQEFEQVEVKPQALEWVLSVACGQPFQLSADNLQADTGPSDSFRLAVFGQVQRYCNEGLPSRAHAFACALAKRFNIDKPLAASHYLLAALK